MQDESPLKLSRAKGRSASICATGSSSMEAIIAAESVTPEGGTPTRQRRRPATRTQSARISGGRSIRRRAAVAATANNSEVKSHYNSEPKLADDSDVSPGIRRKNSTRRGTSVYHRKSTAFLEIPDQRSSYGQKRGEEEDEDSYRLRSFSFTSKGIVNRGDSFRRRRSRSNSLIPPTAGSTLTSPVHNTPYATDNSAPTDVHTYTVALIGAQGVGKTALISQFMTSECINAYDRQKESPGDQSVFIMLNGEESELKFINLEQFRDIEKTNPPHAFLVMYSVVDKASFLRAESDLTRLMEAELLRTRPAILVGNKVDLARSKAVSTQDGKCLACTYRAKFIEISVGINHNVDELIVGVLNQIRMKSEHYGHLTDKEHSQAQWYKSRGVVRASMKARQMFTWLFGKEDTKFKNCENLHIL